MRNYVIVAPPYGKSAGTRALYLLSDILEARGFSAPVLCHVPNPSHHCIPTFTKKMQREDIVIYPEIIKGNPLHFYRVVRYVLYFPGKMGGDEHFDEHEYVITWDKRLIEDVPVLALPLLERNRFYDAGLPKAHDCIFTYKSFDTKRKFDVPGAVHITMEYPTSRDELIHLLQTTRILYSFDHHSLLNDEAVACGAKVKLVTDTGLVDYEASLNFDEDKFQKQLAAFIEATQSLSPHKPQRIAWLSRWQLIGCCRYYGYKLAYALTGKEKFYRKKNRYGILLGLTEQ